MTAMQPFGGAFGQPSFGQPSLGAAAAPSPAEQTFSTVYGALGIVGAVLGAYHGYKRDNSVGWAIGWFFFGGIIPFLALPIMFAEGFAKPAKD